MDKPRPKRRIYEYRLINPKIIQASAVRTNIILIAAFEKDRRYCVIKFWVNKTTKYAEIISGYHSIPDFRHVTIRFIKSLTASTEINPTTTKTVVTIIIIPNGAGKDEFNGLVVLLMINNLRMPIEYKINANILIPGPCKVFIRGRA